MGRESTWTITAASLGVWALGRRLSVDGVRLLGDVLLAGVVLNSVVALAQAMTRPAQGSLVLDAGRAYGLLTHPVYFAAVVAAGCVFAVWTWDRRRTLWTLLIMATCTAGVMVSGSRMPLLLIAIASAGGLVLRPTADRVRGAGAAAVGALVGALASSGIADAVAESGAGPVGPGSALDRLPSIGSAFSQRIELWGYAAQALFDRPLMGYGAGGFRSAVQGRFNARFTQLYVNDDTAPWFDAHNIVVEIAVATGVVGLLLALAFAIRVAMTARGPLALAALVIVLTWAVEPAALATLPIAMLLLGASDGIPWSSQPQAWLAVPLVVIGAALATTLVVTDIRLNRAVDALDPVAIEDVASWLPWDPVAADLVAQAWEARYLATGEGERPMLVWSQRVIDREPNRPSWWDHAARRNFLVDEPVASISLLLESTRLQPWRPQAWQAMAFVAGETGEAQLERKAHDRLCDLGRLDACDAAEREAP